MYIQLITILRAMLTVKNNKYIEFQKWLYERNMAWIECK